MKEGSDYGEVLRMITNQVRAHPELWAQLVVEDQGSLG